MAIPHPDWSLTRAVREGSHVRARIVEHVEALRNVVPSWWDLLDRAAHPQPTQTPLWLLSWWNIYGRTGGRELRIVVIETSGGEVVGIVPLLRRWIVRDAVIPVFTLELLGSGEGESDAVFSEYIGAIAARGYEEIVAKTFAEVLRLGHLGAWDELHMPCMRAGDPMVELLAEKLREQSIEVNLNITHECPFVALPASFRDYLAGLDGPRRYFVRRTLRDLDAWAGPGGAVLRCASSEAELRQGLAILQALHAERWKGKGGGAFRSAPFRKFHDVVTAGLLRGTGGSLDLSWLEVAGTPVAALYNIVYRGDVHFYQSGRALGVPRNVRPGIAIHLLAMQRAIAAGHRGYHFLARADPSKQKLAPSHRHHLVALSAIAPTARARATSEMRRTARLLFGRAGDFTGWSRPATPQATGSDERE